MKKTRAFRLNKLVRDKIIADHIGAGAQVKMRKLSKINKRKELLKKLVEEANESLNSEDLLSELTDMQEVIDQLAKDEGFTKQQIKDRQAAKRTKNGGFKNGDFIERETWPASHPWAKYYAKEPKRFPEVESD